MWSDRLFDLMARARAEGATPLAGLPNKLLWEVYGSCQTPVTTELHARDTDRRPSNRRFASPRWTGTLVMRVPCRKCEGCLRYKAWLWRTRCRAEVIQSPRTWMGSLTLSPEEHFLALCRISSALRKASVDIRDLNEVDVFKHRAADMGKLATLYFKKLRKAKSLMRYILVTEAHKSGLPHLHLLVHEVSMDRPVRKALLQSKWTHGFSNFKLVEDSDRATHYVTKYVAKSMLGRVRASQQYGYQIRPQGIVALKAADVISSHLFETGSLNGLELHRILNEQYRTEGLPNVQL